MATIGVEEGADGWARARTGLTVLGGVLVGGTFAYRLLGLGWVDSLYQTLITVSTVGFTEVGDEPPTDAYRLTTSALIVVGVGAGAYTLGSVFEAFVEGGLQDQIGRNRMQRSIDELDDHVVVAGWGQVGQAIAVSLRAAGVPLVVIDRRADLPEVADGLHVTGEATEDSVLEAAGIRRARGLVVALDADADNLFVTLSGRALNPRLFIVSRANRSSSEAKLHQAGADRVVNPHRIGGDRMASFLVEPHVADFLGETMGDRGLQVRLRGLEVADGPLVGETLEGSGLLRATGVTVLAVRRGDGTYRHHPGPDVELAVGDAVIALGTPAQLHALGAWFRAG